MKIEVEFRKNENGNEKKTNENKIYTRYNRNRINN